MFPSLLHVFSPDHFHCRLAQPVNQSSSRVESSRVESNQVGSGVNRPTSVLASGREKYLCLRTQRLSQPMPVLANILFSMWAGDGRNSTKFREPLVLLSLLFSFSLNEI